MPELKKAICWKWASRLHEVLIFTDLGPQNPSKKSWKIHRKLNWFFDGKNIENWSQNVARRHHKMSQKTFKNRDKKRVRKSNQKRVQNKSATGESRATRDQFPPPNHPPYNSQSSNRSRCNGARVNALPVIHPKIYEKSIENWIVFLMGKSSKIDAKM